MKVVGVAVSRVTGGNGVDEAPTVGVGVIVLVGVFVFSPILVGVKVKVGVGTVGEATGDRVAVKITTGLPVGILFWGLRYPGRVNVHAIETRPMASARVDFLDLQPTASIRSVSDFISQCI